MLSDTHCHLDITAFKEDRDEVVLRSRQEGVSFILNPGIDLESSRFSIQLAEAYPEVYAAVGVHPNEANSWTDGVFDCLNELVIHPKVVAIGEIGLDYYWDSTPRSLQMEILQKQLELALNNELPVIIHCRDRDPQKPEALIDLLAVLDEWRQKFEANSSQLIGRMGVLHSYSGNSSEACRAIELGFFIGITGPVTFKKAAMLHNVVKDVPLEKILIETDSPYLTPHPYRGQRNEPARVRLIADRVAELKNLSSEKVGEVTFNNSQRLFHWKVF